MTDAFRESSVQAGGVRFHYAAAGRGPLVILLHGFPERWTSWRAQIPALAAAGYRVVAPDLRGYGQSDKPASGYDMPTLAGDVAALVTALGEERATVVGHDWGGAVAWEAAALHPSRVARVAVLDCPRAAVLDHVAWRSWDQLQRSRYILFFQLPWLPERVLSRTRGEGILRRFEADGLPADFRETVRAGMASPESVRPMLAYYREAFARSLRGELHPVVPVRQPALLVWGERDAVLSTDLLAPHVRHCSDLTIRRVPDAGHFVQQQRPEAVNALLLAWLRETATRSRAAR